MRERGGEDWLRYPLAVKADRRAEVKPARASILVTGGSGYIGLHTVRELQEHGYAVVVLDRRPPPDPSVLRGATLVLGDVRSRDVLEAVFAAHSVLGVVHIAGEKSVEDSFRDPGYYIDNNLGGSVALLDAMVRAEVRCIVFSSSAAVYGVPRRLPVRESAALRPVNPYGESKLFAERTLHWFDGSHGVRFAALRYFNAAGASRDGDIGEDWSRATNLIPVAMRAVLQAGPPLRIFGTDYATPDGTAVRDYIHVSDLARAHVSALERLRGGSGSFTVNLGTGTGVSVRQVVDLLAAISGRVVPQVSAPRRTGDPPAVWADNRRAQQLLGWRPWHRIDDIVSSAWRWHSGPGSLGDPSGRARRGRRSGGRRGDAPASEANPSP